MISSSEDIGFLVSLSADLERRDERGDYLAKYCLLRFNASTFSLMESPIPQRSVNQINSTGLSRDQVTEMVQKLLKVGADIHTHDKGNNLPGHIAKLTDHRARGFPIRNIGNCRNFESYIEALTFCKYEPQGEQDGDLF